MGFGILLFGYFFLYAIPYGSVDCLTQLFGLILTFWALGKLREYRAEFSLCRIPLAVVLPIDLFLIAEWIVRLTGNGGGVWETAAFWLRSARDLLLLIFNLLLLYAIRAIAKEVELPELAGKAVRNAVMFLFYLALMAVTVICHLAGWTIVTGYLNPTLVLLVLVLWLVMLVHLFSCYKNICAPEDLDMTPGESTFKLFGHFRRRERERSQEIYDAAKARGEADLARRMEKKKQRDAEKAQRGTKK